MVYNVEFPDGVVKEYAANVIVENMCAQVDPDGHTHSVLDSIIDFKKDKTALHKDDMYITTKMAALRKTIMLNPDIAKGYYICITPPKGYYIYITPPGYNNTEYRILNMYE